ncbi:hypothetical protein [Embleya sp. NPDC059237]|uniref:phage terminase small subunit n=1 Tax=Embleya sp. NPDC059237 TaxID=3346784 RepID=UPI00367B5AF1
MGRTTGPVPKRSEERRRRNKPEGPEVVRVETSTEALPVPEADPAWHPIARDWFDSLAESGQSVFYQPSDWQTARYVAEAMSTNLSAGRFSAQLFAAISAAMSSLLVTEGDRRRARVELARRKPTGVSEQPAGVTAIADYRAAIGG